MTGPVPAEMVEAAARALHEHDRLETLNEPAWEDIDVGDRASYREAAKAMLIAPFAVCRGHDEWGVALTPDDDRGESGYTSEHGADRATAQRLMKETNAHSRSRGHPERARLVQRTVFVTPWHEVDAESGGGS